MKIVNLLLGGIAIFLEVDATPLSNLSPRIVDIRSLRVQTLD
jgi:hypothetical protein